MTTFNPSEYISFHRGRRSARTWVSEAAPRVKCKDGFSVSVQAGVYLYCTPRRDEGPWTTFELGFPSAPDPALTPYAEDPDENPTATVYPYVPHDVVVDIIERHGGQEE